MIVVTSVEYFRVEGDEKDIYSGYPTPVKVHTKDGPEYQHPAFIIERIKGRRFRRRDQEWIVGLSDEVADIFQLQAEAWSNMEKELDFARLDAKTKSRSLSAALSSLDVIRYADWKMRLRWLFTGVPC